MSEQAEQGPYRLRQYSEVSRQRIVGPGEPFPLDIWLCDNHVLSLAVEALNTAYAAGREAVFKERNDYVARGCKELDTERALANELAEAVQDWMDHKDVCDCKRCRRAKAALSHHATRSKP